MPVPLYAVPKEKYRRPPRIRRKGVWIYALAALLLSVGLTVAARVSPAFAEWHATTVYPVWVSALGRISSAAPFSIFECLIAALIGYGLIGLALLIIHLVRRRSSRRKTLVDALRRVTAIAMTALLLFTVNGGINYHRKPFSELSGISVRGVSRDDLVQLCALLRDRLVTYSASVTIGDSGCSTLTSDVRETAVDAMHTLGKTYPALAGYYPQPKPVQCSIVMSYNNITGIYSPFTIEANYNRLIPSYNIPLTVCHELSHLRGFMREDEANFIAYLACEASDAPDFRYSGTMLAFLYASNALAGADGAAYSKLMQSLPGVVLQDFRANNAYWQQFATPIADISDKINDGYLKANDQTDGVQSYGRMVDLLVAYELPE